MKKNNKGFTLLEVLIAVIILAFVIVPLLRSFLTSYNVNARSRRIMRATTLAQNEMEIFEKEKLEVLTDDTEDAKYDYTVTQPNPNDPDDPGIYTFTRLGIINYEAGDEDPIKNMFDVVVKLDPERVSSGDRYYDENGLDLLFMNTLSGSDSATYVQKIRNDVNTDGDDEEVYKLYETRQHPEGITGTRWTVEQFAQELSRTITVKIEQVDQGGLKTTVAKVNYEYVCGEEIVPDGYKTYSTKDKVFFNNAQLLDEDGNLIELKSVYLFYAPRYNTPNIDKIVIENKDNLPVNVYIIRQNLLDNNDASKKVGVYTDTSGNLTYSDELRSYVASIEIYEGINEEEETYGSYFTNLNLVSSDNGTKGKTDVTLHDGDGIWTYTGDEAIKKAKFRSLDSTETKDRIYTMEVSVYNHGDDLETDDPLVRLTGSKIE